MVLEALFHVSADAAEITELERMKALWQIRALDEKETVWLAHVGGEFGEKPVGSDAQGAGDKLSEMIAHRRLDFPAEFFGFRSFLEGERKMTPGFIDRQDGRDGSARLQGVDESLMEFQVGRGMRFHQGDAGTFLAGFHDARACFNAVFFSFLAGGNATGGIGNYGDNGDGFASQFRVNLLFHGSKKAVQIDDEIAEGHV